MVKAEQRLEKLRVLIHKFPSSAPVHMLWPQGGVTKTAVLDKDELRYIYDLLLVQEYRLSSQINFSLASKRKRKERAGSANVIVRSDAALRLQVQKRRDRREKMQRGTLGD